MASPQTSCSSTVAHSSEQVRHAKQDRAAGVRTFLAAWGLPTVVIIAGFFVAAEFRTLLWTAALLWMGTACLLNTHRCGRLHCRYTGPFYLALIIPVTLHGTSLLFLGDYGWWVLGAVILFGGQVIWLATETAWGRYLGPDEG